MMMKSATLKTISPLVVTYGVTATDASKHFDKAYQTTYVDAGWIALHHGQDKTGGKVLFLETRKENLLICATQSPVREKSRPRSRPDWAHGVESLPYDFLRYQQQPILVACNQDQVRFGEDSTRRVFMTVMLKGLEMTLLFRDPTSKSSAAWSPHPSTALGDGLSLKPKSTVAGLTLVKAGDSTGDDELDDLLSQLVA